MPPFSWPPNRTVAMLILILTLAWVVCFPSSECVSPVAQAIPFSLLATRTWDGGGADNDASTQNNWSDNTTPVNDDTVIFDGTSTKDCNWDLAITGITYQMNSGYTGNVTLANAVSWDSMIVSDGTFESSTFALSVDDTITVDGVTFCSATTSGAWTCDTFVVNNGSTVNATSGNITIYDTLTLNDACTWTKDGTIIMGGGIPLAAKIEDNNSTAQDIGDVQLDGISLAFDSSDATPEVKLSTLQRKSGAAGNRITATGSIVITVTGGTWESATGFSASTWNTSTVSFTANVNANTYVANPMYKTQIAPSITLTIPNGKFFYTTDLEMGDNSTITGTGLIGVALVIQNASGHADPTFTLGTGYSITPKTVDMRAVVDMNVPGITMAPTSNARFLIAANDTTITLTDDIIVSSAVEVHFLPGSGITGSVVDLNGNTLATAGSDIKIPPSGTDAVVVKMSNGKITGAGGEVYAGTITVSNDGTVLEVTGEFQVATLVQSAGGVARRAPDDVQPSIYQNALVAIA